MRYPDHIMTEKFNWEAFLDPYIQAVGELNNIKSKIVIRRLNL